MKSIRVQQILNMACFLAAWIWMGCQSPNQESVSSESASAEKYVVTVGGAGKIPKTDPKLLDHPLAKYDAVFIQKVQDRWYALIESSSGLPLTPGQVRLYFRLHSNGAVTDLRMLDATVDEKLVRYAEQAIAEGAPYREWPKEMRELVGKDFREIKFTFYYNNK